MHLTLFKSWFITYRIFFDLFNIKMENGPYSFEHLADIHFVYGLANGNGLNAQRLYALRFPNRRLPNYRTFINSHQHLREYGRFQTPMHDTGRPRQARNPAVDEEILNVIDENPGMSTRQIARHLDVSRSTVWRVLHENMLYPYHIQRVQGLLPRDFPQRLQFSRWILRKCTVDPEFLSRILFTDEAQFTRDGVVNYHNVHIWALENPHMIRESRHQEQFSVNIWAGIVGDTLIGPFILPRILNGDTYLNFLQNELPALMEDVPLHVRQQMWFMHDGAPPHFRVTVRDYLDTVFPNRWIGRAGPIAWPPRSPDCNSLDFFLWGHVKSLVYDAGPVPSIEVLTGRIMDAFQTVRNNPGILERVRQSMRRRVEGCIAERGGHFQHLL